jgi:hypothetical protein
MNRVLLIVSSSLGALILGVVATVVVYEAVVVPRLTGEAEMSRAFAGLLSDRVTVLEDTVSGCRAIAEGVSDVSSRYFDAYEANRNAVDNFFDRDSVEAGDADYLYFVMSGQYDVVSAASSDLSFIDVSACYYE